MSQRSLLFIPHGAVKSTNFVSSTSEKKACSSNSRTVPSQKQVTRCTIMEGGTMADALDSVPSALKVSLLQLPDDAEIAVLGERHTKIVATIGPSTFEYSQLLQLAAGGVNMARLNLSHGDFDWHSRVIESIRQINLTSPFVLGILLDLG
eukprot:IDg11892t1